MYLTLIYGLPKGKYIPLNSQWVLVGSHLITPMGFHFKPPMGFQIKFSQGKIHLLNLLVWGNI
jgi:hypothetical protein